MIHVGIEHFHEGSLLGRPRNRNCSHSTKLSCSSLNISITLNHDTTHTRPCRSPIPTPFSNLAMVWR